MNVKERIIARKQANLNKIESIQKNLENKEVDNTEFKKAWSSASRTYLEGVYKIIAYYHINSSKIKATGFDEVLEAKYNDQNSVKDQALSDIGEYMKVAGCAKIVVSFSAVMRVINKNDYYTRHFSSFPIRIVSMSEIPDRLSKAISQVSEASTLTGDITDSESVPSGAVIDEIRSFHIKLSKCSSIGGSSYFEVPDWITSNACINPKNENDNYCLGWSILIHDLIKEGVSKNLQRVPTSRNYKHLIDKYIPSEFEGQEITYPTPVYELELYEKAIGRNISIVKFETSGMAENKKKVLQYHYNSKRAKKFPNEETTILLLVIEKEWELSNYKKSDPLVMSLDKSHYLYVKNLSKLVSTKDIQIEICTKCLSTIKRTANNGKYVSPQNNLIEHQKICNGESKPEIIREFTNDKGESFFKQFRNLHNKIPAVGVVYADFESLCEPINANDEGYDESVLDLIKDEANFGVNSQVVSKQVPFSVAYSLSILESPDAEIDREFKIKRSRNPKRLINNFLIEMIRYKGYVNSLKKSYQDVKQMKMNVYQEQQYMISDICHICEMYIHKTEYGDKSANFKVRDHNHLTGEFRGAAHRNCNLKYSFRNDMIVYFHNLSGYDGKLINKFMDTRYITDKMGRELFECLGVDWQFKRRFEDTTPTQDQIYKLANDCVWNTSNMLYQSNEKMILFQLCRGITFKDTFRTISCSLANLVQATLADNIEDNKVRFKSVYKYLQSIWDEVSDEDFMQVIKSKGHYPYEYATDYDRLLNKKSIPNQKYFNSISDEAYEEAKKDWELFECESMMEYTDIYNIRDTLQLKDCFDHFRRENLKRFKIDPAHYTGAPSYGIDILLKESVEDNGNFKKIHSLHDEEIYKTIMKGRRGGLCTVGYKRYAKVEEGSKDEIQYIDVTSLYPTAMCDYLPESDFTRMEKFTKWDLKRYDESNGKMVYLTVDMHIPDDLLDYFKDLPPFISHMKAPVISPYISAIDKTTGKDEKLIPHLIPVKKYNIFAFFLKWMVERGVKVDKIHQAYEAECSKWSKPYVEKMFKLRQEYKKSGNKIMDQACKILLNAPYGKLNMDIEKQNNNKLLNNPSVAEKFNSSIYYKNIINISDSVAIGVSHKKRIEMKEVPHVGSCILERSKLIMYSAFYDMKDVMGDRMKLLYMDTDSFILHITNNGKQPYFLKKLHKHGVLEKWFDTSTCKIDAPNFKGIPYDLNVKKLGVFTNEVDDLGAPITEFIGLKPKTYSYRVANDSFCIKNKGVNMKASTLSVQGKAPIKPSRQDNSYESILQREKEKNIKYFNFYKKCLFESKEYMASFKSMQSKKSSIYNITSSKSALNSIDTKVYVLEDGINTIPYGYNEESNSPDLEFIEE